MILREATRDDLPQLLPFIKRELEAWGYKPVVTLERLQKAMDNRRRYVFLIEDGAVSAVLSAHPIATERGPAYTIDLCLVSPTHPNRVQAFDALTLFGCNILRSEGIRIIFSRLRMPTTTLYGRDVLDFEAENEDPDATDLLQWGDTEQIIANIFQRRPEWRPSP